MALQAVAKIVGKTDVIVLGNGLALKDINVREFHLTNWRAES